MSETIVAVPDSYTREQLEVAILGAPPALTSDEVAELSGVESETSKRLWRALGFADAAGQAAFTELDVQAVQDTIALTDSGAIDRDHVMALTRALGQTMARLADWEVATLAGRVEELERGEQATGSRLGSATRLVEDLSPGFEKVLVHAWRRHLAAAVARVSAMGAQDADLHTAELTVGFADIVQFSAYSNQHTQARLGEMVEVFESRATDAVATHGGRVIKTLGDSVLYVCDEPEAAYDVAAAIVRSFGRDKSLPDVRVGLATGPVVMRLGDVFGPAVNLAARMTSVARRNRIIADQRTAGLLPPEQFQLRTLPLRPLRGFGDVEPIAVKRL
ncbi:adenylate/guanylate cyclase domain-containing protein [Marmoricola endophyticus]|uniref:Adenylate/guanylate cyclase domain-containing protein n=1 Tax=Marmoricola endophyticus TaxID=2040280 RepID=A0A917F1W4_9ACTN|nr:adenylate/guanylate cyclase domain-containing protein [Marmoricola endophyticus]GGF40255.1 adenylate/guanylate cyclase domain-containing protein [Marmoricola endophyticus]